MSSEYVVLEKDGVLQKKAPAGNWNVSLLLLVLLCWPAAFFVPLVRGDIKWAIHFIWGWVILLPLFGVNKYNFWYIKGLLKKGYRIKSFSPTLNEHILGKRMKMNIDPYLL